MKVLLSKPYDMNKVVNYVNKQKFSGVSDSLFLYHSCDDLVLDCVDEVVKNSRIFPLRYKTSLLNTSLSGVVNEKKLLLFNDLLKTKNERVNPIHLVIAGRDIMDHYLSVFSKNFFSEKESCPDLPSFFDKSLYYFDF